MGENAAYLVPETLKAVRPSLCSVRGKRHSLYADIQKNERQDDILFKSLKLLNSVS